jgi:citrate lyase beta subunit
MDACMLYVPGSDGRKLAKLPSLAAAAFILDLEDAVAASEKARARRQVAEFVAAYGQRLRLYVRINAVGTPHFLDDLEAVVVPGLSGIVLPKVESGAQVEAVDRRMGALEAERHLPVGSIDLMGLVETARGIQGLAEIAGASPRLRRLAFGAGDFSRDLGIDWPLPEGRTSATVVAARSAIVLASRAFGLLAPHDGAYPGVHDLAALRREAMAARDMGYGGKHVIHPAQIPVVQEVFRPTPDQVGWARKVVAAFAAQEAAGQGAFTVDGLLVDHPVAERARQILRQVGEQP